MSLLEPLKAVVNASVPTPPQVVGFGSERNFFAALDTFTLNEQETEGIHGKDHHIAADTEPILLGSATQACVGDALMEDDDLGEWIEFTVLFYVSLSSIF